MRIILVISIFIPMLLATVKCGKRYIITKRIADVFTYSSYILFVIIHSFSLQKLYIPLAQFLINIQ